MTSPPLLSMQGISKRFGATQALGDVNLEVARGEVLALIGENGAGKSTPMLTSVSGAKLGRARRCLRQRCRRGAKGNQAKAFAAVRAAARKADKKFGTSIGAAFGQSHAGGFYTPSP